MFAGPFVGGLKFSGNVLLQLKFIFKEDKTLWLQLGYMLISLLKLTQKTVENNICVILKIFGHEFSNSVQNQGLLTEQAEV